MRVFWGKECPEEAIFSCPGFPKKVPIRIHHLPDPEAVKVVKRTFLPEKKQWIQMVESALEAIEQKKIEKVVLSRIVDLELSQIPDPFAITAALQCYSKGATLFCFADEEKSFLGASPERLFSRHDSTLICEALAGTCWNQRNFTEKELREIIPVQRFIEQALSPLCLSTPLFSPIAIHETPFVRHLRSECQATLRSGISDEKIIDSLHPTPALSGYPQQKALSLIEQLEPFKREFYGSAIGWSTAKNAEYLVAIRSCSIQGRRARLQSGVGIVRGSDPKTEWEELNQKLKIYEKVFL